MRAVLGAITALAISTSATAARAEDVTATATTTSTSEPDDQRSAVLATTISIAVPLAGGTILLANHGDRSTALLGIGLGLMIVGPSIGQWYGHETGLVGVTARAIASIGIAYGVSLRNQICESGDCSHFAEHQRSDHATGTALVYGAAAVFAAATIFDVVMAPRAVSKWNHREVVLAPIALATPAGNTGFGVAFGSRF